MITDIVDIPWYGDIADTKNIKLIRRYCWYVDIKQYGGDVVDVINAIAWPYHKLYWRHQRWHYRSAVDLICLTVSETPALTLSERCCDADTKVVSNTGVSRLRRYQAMQRGFSSGLIYRIWLYRKCYRRRLAVSEIWDTWLYGRHHFGERNWLSNYRDIAGDTIGDAWPYYRRCVISVI